VCTSVYDDVLAPSKFVRMSENKHFCRSMYTLHTSCSVTTKISAVRYGVMNMISSHALVYTNRDLKLHSQYVTKECVRIVDGNATEERNAIIIECEAGN
jgi:hypothetical protein